MKKTGGHGGPPVAQQLYSHLSATSGSTRVALLAGIKHAINATSNRQIGTKTKVLISVAVTPNNKLVISRVSTYAATNPSATPTTVSRMN